MIIVRLEVGKSRAQAEPKWYLKMGHTTRIDNRLWSIAQK